jgi:Anthrone oxygenase
MVVARATGVNASAPVGDMRRRTPWLRLVQVVLIGIQSGRFVDQWFILAFPFSALDSRGFSEAVRSLGGATSVSMPATALVVAILFAVIMLTERDVRSPRGKMTVVALVIFVVVVLITVVHELPLIARIEALGSAPPPAGWQSLRTEWLAGHTLRTLLDLDLFVAVLVAFRLEGRSDLQA